jgi:flavin reductase (DIM6/NTAB) family NADH-FMN oxidoreductase RutF
VVEVTCLFCMLRLFLPSVFRCASRVSGGVSGVRIRNNHSDSITRESVRELLRHTAQPVSVLTLRDPDDGKLLGATLSSFSSISFQPFPIVSFALQLPSRSANALQSHFSSALDPASPSPDTPHPHLVVNILCGSQSDIAIRFSRPDLYPTPFSDLLSNYSLTAAGAGIPFFNDTLGALECSLLSSIPLSGALTNPKVLRNTASPIEASPTLPWLPDSGSVLYLARVLRVLDTKDRIKQTRDDGAVIGGEPASTVGAEVREWPMPLVYHRRRYGTVSMFESS